MFVIKIKGKVKIPDYVQLRDDKFTLLAYFRADRPESALQKAGLGEKEFAVKEFISKMPYGKIMKMEI